MSREQREEFSKSLSEEQEKGRKKEYGRDMQYLRIMKAKEQDLSHAWGLCGA